MTTVLIILVRLGGLIALGLGAAFFGKYLPVEGVPLLAHKIAGGIAALSLVLLAIQGFSRATVVAILAAIVAAATPAIGIYQQGIADIEMAKLVHIAHLITGVAVLGFAEILAKRIKAAKVFAPVH
ncbi:hypothetical protein JDN40_07680 [Rhodomicrobium vannielii ATCC 17100]|uniref:hypothetical protein n=1 Tax=Rhodomicrobium vannielii TaxID=1069 RepID=UPI00191ACE67|nr:hypothetical protein [Rhodomicrobium vannielii]MBJ7533979.1 hypothetical protein [Rhodomicrobium vannielii ATCC 17100]